MTENNNLLIIRQLDKKLQKLEPLREIQPADGWVKLIRRALKMTLLQFGSRMSITQQSLHDIESREKEGGVTIKTLRDVAAALDMTLVYGFLPREGYSLEKMVEEKARAIAERIVMRTSTSMKLEDQENSKERINQAIAELTEEIKREMPNTLWDYGNAL